MRSKAFWIFSLVLLFNTTAFAAGSGSFRLEAPDAGAFGKGAAFAGEANTPAAVFFNPAGTTQIDRAQISIGGTLLGPQVTYLPSSGADAVTTNYTTFFVPHTYAVLPVTNSKFTLGFGAGSYWGLATDWPVDGPFRYVTGETVLENKDYLLTAAYELNPQWSFALGLDIDDSKVSKKKSIRQVGGADGTFQLKGKDTSASFRLAALYKLNQKHQFGLMYRGPTSHTYKGKAYLENLNTSGSNFQSIFGGSSYETGVQETFNFPQSVVLGYSFKLDPRWTFNVDMEWMDWSTVQRETLEWDETNTTRLTVLNGNNPTPRDWRSVIAQSIGTEYAATDKLRLRTGFYHHQTPIPQRTWEPTIPDNNNYGITLGFGYDLRENMTIDMAYSLLKYERRKIDNTAGNSSGVTVDGNYKQRIDLLLFTLTYKF